MLGKNLHSQTEGLGIRTILKAKEIVVIQEKVDSNIQSESWELGNIINICLVDT